MSCELYTQSSGELRQDLLRGIKLVKLCQEMGIDETSVVERRCSGCWC